MITFKNRVMNYQKIIKLLQNVWQVQDICIGSLSEYFQNSLPYVKEITYYLYVDMSFGYCLF